MGLTTVPSKGAHVGAAQSSSDVNSPQIQDSLAAALSVPAGAVERNSNNRRGSQGGTPPKVSQSSIDNAAVAAAVALQENSEKEVSPKSLPSSVNAPLSAIPDSDPSTPTPVSPPSVTKGSVPAPVLSPATGLFAKPAPEPLPVPVPAMAASGPPNPTPPSPSPSVRFASPPKNPSPTTSASASATPSATPNSARAPSSSAASPAPPSAPVPISQPAAPSSIPPSSITAPVKHSPSSVAETVKAAIRESGGVVSCDFDPVAQKALQVEMEKKEGKGGATGSAAAAAPKSILKKTSSKEEGPKIAPRPTGKALDVTLDQLVLTLFGLWVVVILILIWLLRPSSAYLATFTGIGFGISLGFSLLYYMNKKEKNECNQVLGAVIGLKGLQNLLGNLPSWLSYTEKEKMEWFNSIVEEMWPYVDKAVCRQVQQTTETVLKDLLTQVPVPGIKSMKFSHLTFGEAPFRIESIYVNPDTSKFIDIELGIRWCGDANITLAIELTGVTDTNKVFPKVTDISFAGFVRIRLQPLVDTVPGFGAILVSMRKPPLYKYRMDFGAAMGGKAVAGLVQPFINWVVNDVIINMLVWPQRLVVPILPNNPAMDLEIERMSYRCQGVVKVKVIKATGLRSADAFGKSDPLVEMTTDGQYVAETKALNGTLEPEWNETFWLVVHEPKNQEIKVWVSDRDVLSPTDLLHLRFSNVFGAKEFLGRALIRMKPISTQEPECVEQWYNLGEGDWTRPEGPGKGCGKILLACEYRSLENFRPTEVQTAELGIMTFRILRCKNLGAHGGEAITISCIVKCGRDKFTTGLVTGKADHVFMTRNNKDFYATRFDASVNIQIMEKNPLGDDCIGVIEIPITDICEASDLNKLSGQSEHGFFERSLDLEEADRGSVHIQLRYIPYF